MSSLSLTSRWSFQLVLIVTHIVGLLFFLKGFFPSKVVLPGFNEFSDESSPFAANWRGAPQFDKFIVMVVDAMRSDFCYSKERSHMTFLHGLINDGNAIPFTAFSNPPTVTLPRLKGITTGGTPNFLDAILNIADDNDNSQGLFNQDSWIHQYSKLGKKINFFGDDTWLKLFPDQFGETEGTNSFFVSDFTEVDNNVTRHLDVQLDPAKSEWDGLILHYLGLDHIGHKGGPDSVFMKSKQQEMDTILKRLYSYAQDSEKTGENVIIVLMGDHGMNEIGNHGASSAGETNAALSFISPKFSHKGSPAAPLDDKNDYSYYSFVNQIDLVPTLAGLLNFPIPKNSLGVIIPEFLELWKKDDQKKKIVKENCKQLMNLFKAKHSETEHSSIWQQWNKLEDKAVDSTIEEHYKFLLSVQELLATAATNYNYEDIYLGFGLVVFSTLAVLIVYNYYFFTNSTVYLGLPIFFELFTIAYSIHFHGSSLIEEEHQIWWLFTILSCIFLGVTYFQVNREATLYWILLSVGLRTLRAWNNSGQKYSSKYTIASYLLNQYPSILWLLIVVTYIGTAIITYIQGGIVDSFSLFNDRKNGGSADFQQAGNLFAFMSIFISSSISLSFKLCQYFNDGHKIPQWINWLFVWILRSYGVDLKYSINDAAFKFKVQDINIQMARLSNYAILGLLVSRAVLGKIRKVRSGLITDVVNIASLFLLQQTKYENIPIFLVLFLIKFSFTKLVISTQSHGINIDQLIIATTIFTICVQNLSFFSFGNTNSLATVDLSNAYNGVKSYDVFLVGLLTFVSNFAAPIYWSLSSFQIILEPSRIILDTSLQIKDLVNFQFLRKSILLVKTMASLLFYSISATNLVGSCINLRFHLFIWTVFSPKLLFFASWSILMNFLVDLVIAFVILFIFY